MRTARQLALNGCLPRGAGGIALVLGAESGAGPVRESEPAQIEGDRTLRRVDRAHPAHDLFLQVVRLDVGFPGHQLAGEEVDLDPARAHAERAVNGERSGALAPWPIRGAGGVRAAAGNCGGDGGESRDGADGVAHACLLRDGSRGRSAG